MGPRYDEYGLMTDSCSQDEGGTALSPDSGMRPRALGTVLASTQRPALRRFNFDYETKLIVPALQAPPIVCMSYDWDRQDRDLVHVRTGRTPGFPSLRGSNRRLDDILLEALTDDGCVMEAYNAAFEFVVTLAHRADWAELLWRKVELGLWQCAYIREKQIRIARGNHNEVLGLDATLSDYDIPIRLDKKSPWRLRYGTLIDTPIQQWEQGAIDYSLGDLAVGDLSDVQRRTSDPAEYVDHAVQVASARDLYLTSAWGFRTDLEASEQLYRETEERIESAKQIIVEHGLGKWKKEKGTFRVSRVKAPAEARMTQAFETLQLPVPRSAPTEVMLRKACEAHNFEYPAGWHIKKILQVFEEEGIECQGNIKLDFEACEQSRDPVLMAYAEFGSASNLLSRVGRIRDAARAGKPVQVSYNVLVDTGRTSARQGDDPEPGESRMAYGQNIQNLPRSGEE